MHIRSHNNSGNPNQPNHRRHISHRSHSRKQQQEGRTESAVPGDLSAFTFLLTDGLPSLDQLSESGLLIYVISREEIEACDTNRFIKNFSSEQIAPALAKRLMGNVLFVVVGYDDVDLHLCRIPAVCRFYAAIYKQAPCWLFYSELTSFTLKMIFSCILNENLGRTAFSSTQWEGETYVQGLMAFLDEGAEPFYALLDHAGVDEMVGDEHFQEVIEYFKK
jgi:hypothetical protein